MTLPAFGSPTLLHYGVPSMKTTESESVAIAFLRERYDLPSDVIAHSLRVSRLARAFARQERIGSQTDMIAVAALLHELQDYSSQEVRCAVGSFLADRGYSESDIAVILRWVFDSGSRDGAMRGIGTSILWDANLVDEIGATGLLQGFREAFLPGNSLETALRHVVDRAAYVTTAVITEAGESYAIARKTFVTEYADRFRREVKGEV